MGWHQRTRVWAFAAAGLALVGCGTDGGDGDSEAATEASAGSSAADDGQTGAAEGGPGGPNGTADDGDSAGDPADDDTGSVDDGPSVDSSDDGGSVPGTEALAGYWVWTRAVENGEVVMDVALADMLYGAADDGWANVGTNKVAFSTAGVAHWTYHVRTLSDYHFPGSVTVESDSLTFHQSEFYSCRHSNEDDPGLAEDRYARWYVEDDELWLSASGFGDNFRSPPLLGAPPEGEPERWIVFQRLEASAWHNHPLLPSCFEAPCNALCGSTDVLGEGG